jgi:hypothetical protein
MAILVALVVALDGQLVSDLCVHGQTSSWPITSAM